MSEITQDLTPCTVREMRAAFGGDGPTTGPVAPAMWLVRALAWMLDNPPASSDYYYCKTGLPS